MVIGLLSLWMYEEYLNNVYLQIYVNNLFQTVGWVFAVLAVIALLGSVARMVSRSKSSNKPEPEKLETVSMKVEQPAPSTAETSPMPPPGLSPIVAQLKAELASRLAPGENVSVPEVEEKARPLAARPLATPEQAVQPSPTNPVALPASTPQPTPSTVIIGMVPQKKGEKSGLTEEKPTKEQS